MQIRGELFLASNESATSHAPNAASVRFAAPQARQARSSWPIDLEFLGPFSILSCSALFGTSRFGFARSIAIDGLRHTVDRFPAFEPHALLRNGHLQTIAGIVLPGGKRPYRAVARRILLPDGDVTMLHDDRPADWRPTSPTALLVHGLTGCHHSPYVVHAAGRLNAAGVRTFRLDMRGSGAVAGLSRMPYHAGCSDDLLAAVRLVAKICPASPLSLVGYSIGGNIALKLAGEAAGRLPPQLNRLIVVSPPIDLQVCVDGFSRGLARLYDRYLAMTLHRQLRRSKSLTWHAPHIVQALHPRGQREFDDGYTSTVWGFETVEQFYADSSSSPVIADVRIPTLLIASRDDPLVPVALFERLPPQPAITLHLTDHGGHLGFIGRRAADPDRRWLDWRIVDFITAGQAMPSTAAA